MTERLIRVLLIDESEDDYVLAQRLLKIARFDRFHLDWTQEYDAGLASVRSQNHDAYLVDHQLKDRSGLDLVREAIREGCSAPLILLTPQGDDGSHLDALLSGSADYLDKTRLDAPLLERSIRHAIDRTRHFEELRRSEERFRALVENLSDGITMLGRDGTVTYASRSTTVILGYPAAELIGRNVFEHMHPDDLALGMRLLSESLTNAGAPVVSQYRYRTREGSWRHLESVMVNRLHEPAVRAIVATIRDVSERKESERDQQNRERQFRALFDSALDAMVLVGDDRFFLDANPAACQLFRLPRERLLSQKIDRFCPPDFPVADRWTDLIEAGEFKGDFALALDERNHRSVELSARAHVLPGRHLLVLRDVTERNELEAKLRQAAKMEAVGRLAGGIAHDFNNLLTAILGCCELLRMELEQHPAAWEDIEEIRRAAARAGTLTQQLLAFSRRQVLSPKVLDLNTEVEHIRRMLGRLIGEDIELITRLEPQLGRIRADPNQLEQILLNLAINARDAMPDGGTLVIETANAEPPEEWANPPAETVVLVVRDSGSGMDESVQRHIFEPFFTTKEMGKGTGLGLATVYGIVKQSEGYITVDSRPGQGATFKVFLPRVEGLAETAARTQALAASARGSETILLVEDEVSVRRLARRVLHGQGYTVIEAATGREALRLASEHPGRLHLLLTDVIMPGMSGPELAERLIREQAQLKVIYMSGYADEALGHHGILEDGVDFLQKPFSPQDLARRVRERLGPQQNG
jgi:two-component system cell cycle sensor histidine kinase/response regulator CckA